MPCLEALTAHDPESRRILGATRASIVFRVAAGPAVTIRLEAGMATCQRGAGPAASVVLLFLGDRHLNAFFSGNAWAVPLPVWGGWRLALLARFTRLTDRLKAVMDGAPGVLASAEGRALHARLSLIAAGLGLEPLADGDGPARALLANTPFGLASFTIGGTRDATVWFDHRDGGGRSGWGEPPRCPDVEISFVDSAVAYGAMRSEIDTIAAIGAGRIRVAGLVPLAEGVNLAMERIVDYLQA